MHAIFGRISIMDKRTTVSIIIPCYKAKNKIGVLVTKILDIAKRNQKEYNILLFIVDDCCPEKSWTDIPIDDSINLIHHDRNLGVGHAYQTGLNVAMNSDSQIFIKIDADGQHAPEYLNELIPYVDNLPRNQLSLTKGTRYMWPQIKTYVPFLRRLGSFLIEPIARAALGYRGLTDIANGYFAMNRLTAKYLFNKNIGTNLKSRYLFESSLLERCSTLGCNIHEFIICSRYGPDWTSSMEPRKMILSLFFFWISAISRRIINLYLLSLNLGSLFLLFFITTFSVSIAILYHNIMPLVMSRILVSAGISSLFTSSLALSFLTLFIFFFYDYASKIKVHKIKFSFYLDDLLVVKNLK